MEETTDILATDNTFNQAITNNQAMTPLQRQRLNEQKHLAQTKLNHVDDSLEALRKRMDWLRRWDGVHLTQNEVKQRLQELNKQYACINQESQELQRFETFEHMQGCYQRVKLLEEDRKTSKQIISDLEREHQLVQQHCSKQDSVQQQKSDARASAMEELTQSMNNIFLALQLEKKSSYIAERLQDTHEEHEKLDKLLDKCAREKDDISNEIELTTEQLEHHRTGRQNLEAHRRMMENGEAILVRLDYLRDEEKLLTSLRRQRTEASAKQEQENILLERVFADYQSVLNKIENVTNDLESHRQYISGTDRVVLEGRTQQLHSRRQMLMSAQSLWNRIASGYVAIDEKSRQLNEHRLHLEHTQRMMEQIEEETAKLRRLCNEKEYTYMLSKSQNVVQLRNDLQEGTACSVCGAIHHPYHSDTMLEQSKLIGEFRSEYEIIANELRGKEKTLLDLKLDLAMQKGRFSAEERELSHIEKRQVEDVREWTLFAPLDRTFNDCSPSTNLDARQAMLRTLLNNTAKEAEKAQVELDAFNFHQEQISTLSEKLQKLEQRKGELNIRLGEVNTGCQVMAGQVERLQQQIDASNERFATAYDILQQQITLPDWYKKWQSGHEYVREQIQQMLQVWHNLNKDIRDEEQQLALLQTQSETLQRTYTLLNAMQDENIQLSNELTDTIQKAESEHERIVPGATALSLYQQLLNKLTESQIAEQKEKDNTRQMRDELARVVGKSELYRTLLDAQQAKLASERSALDIFINNYNSANPPVQYAQLEGIFQNGKDWSNIRSRVNAIVMERNLTQKEMDALNSRIVSLEAEGGVLGHQDTEVQMQSTIEQYEKLMKTKKELLLQIARYEIRLEE